MVPEKTKRMRTPHPFFFPYFSTAASACPQRIYFLLYLCDDRKLRQQELRLLLTALPGVAAVGEILEGEIRRAALGDVRAQLRRLGQAEDARGRHELDAVLFGELVRVRVVRSFVVCRC